MPQFLMHFTDDTILVLPPNLVQFAHIKNLLMHFTAFTRLKFNYDKSLLVPINVPESQLPSLISLLGCKKGSFPFTYLGLPISTSRPNIEDFNQITQRIERRLTGCSTLLSYAGRLLLIKPVFAALAIFFMSTLTLPAGVVVQLDKYLRSILWMKFGIKDKGTTLIAWSKICKPKLQRDLVSVILQLRTKRCS